MTTRFQLNRTKADPGRKWRFFEAARAGNDRTGNDAPLGTSKGRPTRPGKDDIPPGHKTWRGILIAVCWSVPVWIAIALLLLYFL
jgi:hypothetical protein